MANQHSEHDCISRESGLALIEDAQRWSKAYMEARDELRSTQEQLEAAERERDGAIQALDRETAQLHRQLETLHRQNKALYAEMARLPNRQAAEAFGRVREYVSAGGSLCGDPCPEASDLDSCLLPEGHGGEWHQNRSSSWPVSNPAKTYWTCAWCGHENGHDGVMCDECHHYGQPPESSPAMCRHVNTSEHPKYAIDDEPGHYLCLDCGDKFPLIGDTDKWEPKAFDPALCRHGYDLTQEDDCPLCRAVEALSSDQTEKWCRICGVYGCEHVFPGLAAQSPASSPDCPICDGIGAQAGAHTERVEPCPICAGSGKL